jgi:hypothetical protein
MNGIFSAKTIKAALLVGTLDILAACIQFYLKTNKGPVPIFKYIASGVFGEKAFTDGNIMIICGLLLHYFIAFIFTFFFFWVGDIFPNILKWKFATGILYGVFIWSVMNFLVLPLSNIPKSPFNFTAAVIATLILIACIGIPLSFIASKQINPKK